MKCDICKKSFKPGNDKYGIPNGIGFMRNGKVIYYCAACIIKIGQEKLRGDK